MLLCFSGIFLWGILFPLFKKEEERKSPFEKLSCKTTKEQIFEITEFKVLAFAGMDGSELNAYGSYDCNFEHFSIGLTVRHS